MLNRYVAILRWGSLIFGFLIVLVFVAVMVGEPGRGPSLWKASLETFMTWCLLVWLAGLIVACRWTGTGALISLAGIAGFYGLQFALSGSLPGGMVFPAMWLPPLILLSCWVYGKSEAKQEHDR